MRKERERNRYRVIINFQTLRFQKLLILITHSYTCQNACCKEMGRQELSIVSYTAVLHEILILLILS